MTERATELAPLKPRRFPRLQFSLRTLCLVLWLYGAAWTLSATWGCADMRKYAIGQYRAAFKYEPSESDARAIETSCYCPFVVRVSSPARFGWSVMCGSERHFWLLGWHWRLSGEFSFWMEAPE